MSTAGTRGPEKGLGKIRHREAAHDIPLLDLLLAHHCTLIIAAYDPAIRQRHPLANAARAATEAVEELRKQLHKQARKEYPKADWIERYAKEYSGTAWPPRITEDDTEGAGG